MPLSPMMQQYLEIKSRHQDQILFFRLGDFYEMFFDDAKLASNELELTLTGRDCGLEERAPMCGVPYHSCEAYIARLVKKGYKVAICEQMENPQEAKGVVKREVVRVITPGTVIETGMLDEGVNNFIACAFAENNAVGLAFCDITTGEVYATEIREKVLSRIKNEIGRFAPSEFIFNADFLVYKEVAEFFKERISTSVELVEETAFDLKEAMRLASEQFGQAMVADLALEKYPLVLGALGALLIYLRGTQKKGVERIISLEIYGKRQYMNLDFNAVRNLELLETMRVKEKKGSLLWTIDKTKTAMGKRLLRTYVEKPLINPAQINKRLNAVEELHRGHILREDLRGILSNIFDLERIMTRIVYGSVNPRELKSLEYTLRYIPQLKGKLAGCEARYLREVFEQLDELGDIAGLIAAAVCEEPPVNCKNGGVIKKGYDQELDSLKELVSNSKSVIAGIEAEERQKTGIKNLRIGYNRVFGYYIEVTKSNSNQVPESYIRKQTLTNCERYVTPELKELEERILTAGERIVLIEGELYSNLLVQISSQLHRVQATAGAVARLDVYAALAHLAAKQNYVRPHVDLSGKIVIKEGRHPVVEDLLVDSSFVPNDTLLDQDENQIAVITGPNMAGKSTYMRQVALIVLLAQIGSFVPAKSASIGVVDAIFTRVGASDDLASGQSTFMVEMNEVADILREATRESLIILDEIGRGTSTYDGMSIARAVIEYISDRNKLGAKTLFATHYHELTDLEQEIACVKNYNVAVTKRGYDITFLRRILPGPADDSYGIEVSRLAGIPDSVIRRAKEILNNLETVGDAGKLKAGRGVKRQTEQGLMQMMLNDPSSHPALERIRAIQLDDITPKDALNLLYELRALVKER